MMRAPIRGPAALPLTLAALRLYQPPTWTPGAAADEYVALDGSAWKRVAMGLPPVEAVVKPLMVAQWIYDRECPVSQ